VPRFNVDESLRRVASVAALLTVAVFSRPALAAA
jgi:hypothetical protein